VRKIVVIESYQIFLWMDWLKYIRESCKILKRNWEEQAQYF